MAIIEQLHDILPEKQVSTQPDQLSIASHDESTLGSETPIAVVWPANTEQVQKIVLLCIKEKLPITTRGAGSALEGSTIPSPDGLVLDLSRMTAIKQFWPEDLQVEVEPGIIYDKLNDLLKNDGLFFPPSPGGSGDIATVGGMVATNASGIYSVKYGGTRDYILALEVVTGTGEIVKLGNRAVKRSSGYNLVELLVGSEGTLGIITSITLKLSGLPEDRRRSAFRFNSESDAARAVSEMCRYGLDLAAIEFLDRRLINALNKLKNYGIEETPSLFLEFHGPAPLLDSNEELSTEICSDCGGIPLQLADGQNPWEIRHWATDAVKHYQTGYSIFRNDVAFPISKLPEMVEFCYEEADKLNITLFTFGHVGLGLLHALMLARPAVAEEWELVRTISNRIIEKTISLGGTISGEHGIGIGHKDLFELEHGESVELMRKIKRQFDPYLILNPGKIFDLTYN